MNIKAAKRQVANKHGFSKWDEILWLVDGTSLDVYIDEVILLYHASQKNL